MNDPVRSQILMRLERALNKAWGADTAKGIWTPFCPCMNQCAVTAMIVQDFLGGELLRCPTINGDSHYWNRVNNEEIDLTYEQFSYSGDAPLKKQYVVRERSYLDGNPDTLARYNILAKRVEQFYEEWRHA